MLIDIPVVFALLSLIFSDILKSVFDTNFQWHTVQLISDNLLLPVPVHRDVQTNSLFYPSVHPAFQISTFYLKQIA